jgi:hypothetical protein
MYYTNIKDYEQLLSERKKPSVHGILFTITVCLVSILLI